MLIGKRKLTNVVARRKHKHEKNGSGEGKKEIHDKKGEQIYNMLK